MFGWFCVTKKKKKKKKVKMANFGGFGRNRAFWGAD